MSNKDLSVSAVLQKYDQYSNDYERRFITSVGLFSAAGLAFCFTSSRFVNNPERFLIVILPSLWLFVTALVFSGITPFCKSRLYRKVRNSVYSGEKAESLKANLAQNKELIASLKVEEDTEYRGYKIWMRASQISLFIAGAALIGALVWPLLLLTYRGYI